MAPVTVQLRDDIKNHLDRIIEALESHPLWVNNKHPSIYFLRDFVKRGRYMLSEYDNVLNGLPLQHADQFCNPPRESGENAALKVFQEVCGRTMMLKMFANDTTGRMSSLTGYESNDGFPIDYGDKVKQAVESLEAVVPKQHMMAGLMG
ncbi:hypothetical protein SBOR_5963 [Sclerotinia borealis F-4128]|uniref:Uncharacterized protein n=1 Tax=Sclerotinia borealis (strain F-4128) TaxID=1432307 RepID=W9CCV4_SCLBF|nr:hypothetical protein SBOR_5963 [Sclerotinia borealis F-4128]